MNQAWREQAACRGKATALFYPGRFEEAKAAKAICEGCPVKGPCLEDAMQAAIYHDYGVRGGLTAEQRDELRRRKRRGAA